MGCIRCLLVLGLVAVITLQHVSLYPAVSHDTPFAGVPNYEWKFLSAGERAAVEKSIEVIRHQRIKNVTLNIVDDSGKPYTGPVQVTQDSTSFGYAVGLPDWPVGGKWKEYFAVTPSRSYTMYVWWKDVERVRGVFGLASLLQWYADIKWHGVVSVDFYLGPYLASGVIADENTLPEWARSLDYDSLKSAMKNYVEHIATAFKGKIHYYHLWTEANAYYGNGNWPLDRIIDIVKMEVTTINWIDPTAKTCIDLDNITPHSLQLQNQWGRSNWTTEDFVRKVLAAGVPFDVIGLETHYGSGWEDRVGGVDTLYNRLIELQRFGKPIYMWEDGTASYVEPQYLTDESFSYLWHGIPTEEKQAEKMVAEAIVYLGNPSVAGVKYLILTDWVDFALYWYRFDGVIYVNGTEKKAFYALEQFWNNLKVNLNIQSSNGTVTFRGLAGNYTVAAEGYRPIRISVAEGATASFGLRLVPLLSTTTSVTSSAMVTTTHSAATSTHAGETSQVMNALLTTPIGNILLVALALTITIAAAIVARSRIRRSSPQQNMKGSHASAGG